MPNDYYILQNLPHSVLHTGPLRDYYHHTTEQTETPTSRPNFSRQNQDSNPDQSKIKVLAFSQYQDIFEYKVQAAKEIEKHKSSSHLYNN